MQKGHTVMVIDDDNGMRELLSDILTKKGYDVTPAIGGKQALQLITQSKPDLIIVDSSMDGMDGLTFLKQLRSFDAQQAVIMLTAFSEDVIENEAKKLGVNDFLHKSVAIDLFMESVSRFVAPKQFTQASCSTKGFILVVDNDPGIRDILKKFLALKNYEVICVESAEKAFTNINEKKPDLILLEINLPGMDGITALKKFKEIDKKLGVIIISGNTEVELAKEAIESGASDYIMKPFNMEYLELSVMTQIFMGES